MSPRAWIPLLAVPTLLLVAVAVALLAGSPSRAQQDEGNHIVYLSVSGEGPTAKAWYKGAPPAGVAMQDALDTFAEQGYHVSEVRPYTRQPIVVVSTDPNVVQAQTRDEYFIILLER